MVGDRGENKGPGGVPPPDGQADHGDNGDTWGGLGVAISPGGSGTGSRGTTTHKEVHYEAAGNHIRKGGLLPHL